MGIWISAFTYVGLMLHLWGMERRSSEPVVGIGDTGSGFNNCHRHMPELIEAVKRGVLMAGVYLLYFRQSHWERRSLVQHQ